MSKKNLVMVILLIVFLIGGVGGVSYYLISKDNVDSENSNNELFTKDKIEKFINDSLVSEYLDTQSNDISDVKSFLENYDNYTKMINLIGTLDYNTPLTKSNILKAEIEYFGMHTGLVFKDLTDSEGYTLYTYDSEKEEYISNGGYGGCAYYIFSRVEDIKKEGNDYVVTVTKAWSDAMCQSPAYALYKSFSDARNRVNKIYDIEGSYNGIGDWPSYDELYNLLFNTNNFTNKLDQYQYVMTYDENYIIKSYKKIS